MNREHRAAQMLLRLWPFPRGSGRLVDKCFSNTIFRENEAVVVTTDGFAIKVLPNDLIGRHIYLTGEFDRSNVEVLLNFAEPEDALLDIGANIGYVSACILQNVRNSIVTAIEPQPILVDLLKENLAQFGNRQTVLPFAFSDRDGIAPFQTNLQNLGGGYLSSDGGIRVEVRSASSLLSKIDKLDLVKIDVEGHEETVMMGSREKFETLQPKIILFEEHGNKCSPNSSLGSLIREMGYSLFGIQKRLHRLNFLPINSPSDCMYNDYVAVSRSRQIPELAARRYGLIVSMPERKRWRRAAKKSKRSGENELTKHYRPPL